MKTFKEIKKLNDMTEKRNISITKEQAIEWYHGDNQTLKQLALSTFSEEELSDYSIITNKLPMRKITIEACSNSFKYEVLAKWETLALYYNTKSSCKDNSLYFIKTGIKTLKSSPEYLDDLFSIGKHAIIRCPGIIYFNRIEDLKKAFMILNDFERSILRSA